MCTPEHQHNGPVCQLALLAHKESSLDLVSGVAILDPQSNARSCRPVVLAAQHQKFRIFWLLLNEGFLEKKTLNLSSPKTLSFTAESKMLVCVGQETIEKQWSLFTVLGTLPCTKAMGGVIKFKNCNLRISECQHNGITAPPAFFSSM
jgi:hypothetical protein